MRCLIQLAMASTIAITFSSNAFADVSTISNPVLRSELLRMQDIDQDARNSGGDDEMRRVDALHIRRLKKIVKKSGWPKISEVGHDGAYAAWLIAQHSDTDRPFQVLVIRLLEPLVKNGEAAPQALAYLHDRTHEPQRYGTQGSCGPDGQWVAREIEDPAHLNERLQAVGLPPFEEYARNTQTLCDGDQARQQKTPARK